MSEKTEEFKCPLCPVVTSNRSALKCHVVSHTTEQPFKCPNCEQSFSRSSNLNAHIRRLHSSPAELKAYRKHKCYACDFAGDNIRSLKVHLQRHTGEKPLTCPEEGCGKQFVEPCGLHNHVRVHTGERPFKCEFPGCEYRARVKHMLTDHWAVHDNERPFKCPVPECNYSAKLKSTLYKHGKVHSEPKYACSHPGCEYRGRQKIHVRNHETTHNDLRHFKCTFPGCDYRGKTLCGLSNHKKIHATTMKPHACTFGGCDRRFLRRWELAAHQRSHTEEPYRCDFAGCGYKSWRKNDFKSHQAMHKPRKFPCTVHACTYLGKSQRHLKKHMKEHSDPLYTSCPMLGCQYRSRYPIMMKRHTKMHESELGKHACALCSRHYEREVDLEAHIRTHTGEKPFECLECQFQTTRTENIETHMKRRHGPLISEPAYWTESQKKCRAAPKAQAVHVPKLEQLETEEMNALDSRKILVKSESEYKPVLDDEQKKLACPACHEFYEEEDLDTHVLNHREGKPFECPHCNFSCVHMEEIIGHVSQRHRKVFSFTDVKKE